MNLLRHIRVPVVMSWWASYGNGWEKEQKRFVLWKWPWQKERNIRIRIEKNWQKVDLESMTIRLP